MSLGIATPGYLRELLLKIQAELSHHLRLPVDPNRELWKYYNVWVVSHVRKKKLLVLMSIPLLDRESIFGVNQATNSPIPYPQVEQGLGVVVKYQVEQSI